MSVAYRGLDWLVEERRRALVEEAERPALARARRAYEKRVARTWSGAAGVLGALATFGDAVVRMATHESPTGELTTLLLASPAVAAAVYLVARLVAHLRLRALLARPLAPTGDSARDLAALEAAAPARVLERLAGARETASVALPMMAASLLAPLSLHYVVALFAGWTAGFDQWITMSVAIVGHAHLGLALCTWRFAVRARTTSVGELYARFHRDWATAFLVAVLCGAVPGVLLFAIPPVLVGVTGIAFIPAVYALARRAIASERADIAGAI